MALNEQMVPALIAALVREGVPPETVEAAVARAVDAAGVGNVGRSVTGNEPMRRAFAFQQAALLERAWR